MSNLDPNARQATIGFVYCTKCRGTRFYVVLNFENTGLLEGEDQIDCADPIKGIVCVDCKQGMLTDGNAALAGPASFDGDLPEDKI